MIRKLFTVLAAVTFCLAFPACEMHPPSTTADHHSKEEKKQSGSQQPQSNDPNAPQFFPEKKAH